MINILDLNEYVLIKIFEYCTENDLENLLDVCKLFHNLIDSRIYYAKSLNLLLSGHNNNPINCKRTVSILSYGDRIKISNNLINGRYTEKIYFNHNKFYQSKIDIDNEYFYMTHCGMLRIHKRTKFDNYYINNHNIKNYNYNRKINYSKIGDDYNNHDALERRIFKEIGTPTKSDITDFKKHNNIIFSGRKCGICFIYDIDTDDLLFEENLHSVSECLMSVEFSDNIYVTSTDKLCKLWYKSLELGLTSLELHKEYDENFKCLNILPNANKIIGGKYTDVSNRMALREIDIETGKMKILNSNTLSIYDLKHQNDNVILTANFDTTFRLYDRRTDQDELIWTDPYDSSIYCLEYDGLYGVLCGMKYNTRVNLYDIRVPEKFIQMYFPIFRKIHHQSSPVYSITCDCRYLFLATDHNLRVWDFKSNWAESRDYRNIFGNL